MYQSTRGIMPIQIICGCRDCKGADWLAILVTNKQIHLLTYRHSTLYISTDLQNSHQNMKSSLHYIAQYFHIEQNAKNY